MRIATWNVNSLTVRLEHVLTWMQSAAIDVLMVQETKVTDDKFPQQALESAGFHVAYMGQKTYNGVAIIARDPIEEVMYGFPEWEDEQKRVIAATVKGLRLVNVYVPNGSSVGSEKYQYKMAWLEACQRYLRSVLDQYDQVVLAGDFNIAPKDCDVHDPKAWEGHVLVSPPEREAYQAILGLGLEDSFDQLYEEGPRFTWWDYRQAGFRRNLGLRIDHLCVTPSVLKKASACLIDPDPRGWERPSDHTPVVLTLESHEG